MPGRQVARLARTAAAVAAAFVMTACGSPPAADTARPPHEVASPSERAVATAQPALLRITGKFAGRVRNQAGSYANNGQVFTFSSTCTGFGVHPDGYIATVGSCVDTSSTGGVRDAFIRAVAEQVVAGRPDLRPEDVLAHGRSTWTVEGPATGSPVVSEIRVTGIPGAPSDGLPARVVAASPILEGDVGLLKVETSNLPVVELTTGRDVPAGTPLVAAGYPETAGELLGPDVQPSIMEGTVTGTETIGSGPAYEISTVLVSGMSGGPAVDHTGRVFGLVTRRGSATEQFNFALPASGITELLGRNGARNDLGPHDRLYREALHAYYTGEYTDASAALDRLLGEAPTRPGATTLHAKAESARERHGDASENRLTQIVTWSAAGVGAVLVVVVGVLLVARRRRARPVVHTPAPHPPFAQPQQQGAWFVPYPQPGGAARPYHPYDPMAPTATIPAARRPGPAPYDPRFAGPPAGGRTSTADGRRAVVSARPGPPPIARSGVSAGIPRWSSGQPQNPGAGS
jgi:S1-C subfamily serine protease